MLKFIKTFDDVVTGVIVTLKLVATYELDEVEKLVVFESPTTCNTAPVAACMLSMPVAPVIVVVITYPFGLAAFTAVRNACSSVRVSPPSKRA